MLYPQHWSEYASVLAFMSAIGLKVDWMGFVSWHAPSCIFFYVLM